MEEEALEELAVEEILKDLKRGAERAKEHGALGWQKNPAPPTNKRFLRNMLVSTLRDNRPLATSTKRKLSTKQQQDGQDASTKKINDSDTYFRYNDKYRHSVDGKPLDSEGTFKRDLLSNPTAESHLRLHFPEDSVEEKTFLDSRRDRDYESTADASYKPSSCEKRLLSCSSDSEDEKRNRGIKEKRKHRKRHKKASKRDSEDADVKKKQKKSKKSKKSKKHKTKRSHHSTNDSL